MTLSLVGLLMIVFVTGRGLVPQGARRRVPDGPGSPMSAADPAALADPEALFDTKDPANQLTATATAGNTPARPTIITYEIKSGDTIWDLASRFGVTVDSIIASNGLSSSGRIGPGQSIKVPSVPGIIVRVKSGETLWSLAQRYGLKTADIAAANGLDEQAAVRIGDELLLPGALAISQPVQVASRGTSRSSGSGSSNPSAFGFIWPVHGPITSSFGPRSGGTHTGLDIGVGMGTSVHAAKAGSVVSAGWISGYGLAAVISHGGGVTTLYAHNSKLLVKAGDSVGQGDVIALSGSTGRSTGPHVHFEIRVNGQPINPLSRLP
jgi:murein DD-endopeptidase MepM/ murein hydrolase activator NlpD